MQKRSIQRGRPAGATTFEPEPAQAFGAAVCALRTEQGVAQETLAHLAGIERSHMGKIERGEHMPTLAMILKIARALSCSAADLMTETEHRLGDQRRNDMVGLEPLSAMSVIFRMLFLCAVGADQKTFFLRDFEHFPRRYPPSKYSGARRRQSSLSAGNRCFTSLREANAETGIRPRPY